MNDVLMILNPRAIPESMQALESLPIPKVWFRAFTEKGLEKPISDFIESTDYDNYIIISDDTVPTKANLELVRFYLYIYPVVTGWSVNHPGGKCANLMLNPHTRVSKLLFDILVKTRYADENVLGIGFEPIRNVLAQPLLFRSYFAGFSLTGMRRNLWLRYPFKTMYSRVFKTWQCSDWCLSLRLNKDKVPIVALRESKVTHLKSRAYWRKEQSRVIHNPY